MGWGLNGEVSPQELVSDSPLGHSRTLPLRAALHAAVPLRERAPRAAEEARTDSPDSPGTGWPALLPEDVGPA